MNIRKGTEEDSKLLAEFHRGLDEYNLNELGLSGLFYGLDVNDIERYEVMMKNNLEDKNNIFYIAEEREPIGFALVVLEPNKFGDYKLYALLDFIFVKPDSQRKGVGQEILNAIMADLKYKNVVGVSSYVFINNERSMNFHNKNGFKAIATSNEMYKPLN